MTFAKIRPSGFAANSKLLSTEMTSLDTDHANALDKTGDSLAATITWTANGPVFATGAVATWQAGSTATWAASSTATFNNIPHFKLGMLIDTAGTFQLDGAGSLGAGGYLLTDAGSLGLILGNDDYPKLNGGHAGISQTRSYLIAGLPSTLQDFSATYTFTPTDLGRVAHAAGESYPLFLPPMWSGATLASVKVYMTPVATHPSVPDTFPSISIRKKKMTAGAAFQPYSTGDTLVGAVTFASVLVAAWNDTNVHSVTLTLTEAIDSDYIYYLVITDESGGGATIGNKYQSVDLVFGITDLRPQ